MRIKNTVKNGAYGFISYFLQIILTFAVRKVFLMFLSVELLGYEGLFSSLFTVMSVADLGSATFISYRLYNAVALNDKEKINKLLSIYKRIYIFSAKVTLIVGIVLSFGLKIIIKDNSFNWNYVYFAYFLQLISIILNYLLSYTRIVFVSYQKEAENTKIDFIVSCITSILKIVIIIVYKSYVMYLMVKIVDIVVANVIIRKKVESEYSWINPKIPFEYSELKDLGVIKDIKNGILSNISGIVYFATDNIVISSMIGITEVGLTYNYSTITSQLGVIVGKITNPFQSTIANFINSESREKGNELFHMFDKIGFFMASFVFVSLLCLANPFIDIVFGSDKTLSIVYVIIVSFDLYIAINHGFVSMFRYCFGDYDVDRNCIILAAFLNLSLSFVLAPKFGVSGVKIATVVGQFGFWIGRVKVLYKRYINESKLVYLKNQIANILVLLIESSISFWLCCKTADGIIGFGVKCLICLIVPNAINYLINKNTKEYIMLCKYFKKTKEEIRGIRE